MSEVHTYKVRSAWSGNRQGTGTINGDGLSSKISLPNNLDGPGVGTNPEELLLGAASGCYVITLAIILSNRKVPYTRLELESEGFVVDDGGLRFDRIEHRPTIYVDQPVDHEKISLYAEQAEHACMVSSALRGNVQVTVHPQVLMEPARTT